jgi:hypothetical protein
VLTAFFFFLAARRLVLSFELLPRWGIFGEFSKPENAGATFQAASQFNALGMCCEGGGCPHKIYLR